MYLYNVTIIVENDIRNAVKQHIHNELLSKQGTDRSIALLELLDSPHEGTTYCVQFRCTDRTDIVAFQVNALTSLQTDLNAQHPGKVVFFDSIMQYLND